MFYMKISEILPYIDKTSFEDNFKNKKHSIEHNLGRFLTKYTAKNQYKIENPLIIKDNGKPKFVNSEIHFSISHSKDIVAVIFDENVVGLDIEFMKNRDFESISNYLKLKVENHDMKTFYKHWTRYEAEYKSKKQDFISFIIENDYMCSISSYEQDLNVYKVELNTDLKSISVKNFDKMILKFHSIAIKETL